MRHPFVAATLLTSSLVLGRAGSVARADGADVVRPPERVSETGLYLAPGTTAIDPANRPYSPQYPLWSDGAGKARWIHLPPGSKIDVSDADAWSFPVGTKLWKEFAFDGRKVETRMLWLAAPDTWVFAAYVWNDDQADAVLAAEGGARDPGEIAPGRHHWIPGLSDCRICHEGGRGPVLGFTALQLSTDRDPLAPHAEPLGPDFVTLATLVAGDLLSPRRPELVARPPRMRARTPRERAALGYLSANCAPCHNARGPLAPLGLILDHPDAALATTVDVPGRYVVPTAPPGASRRAAPGAPENSAIVYRMRSRRPSSQMPPLGSELVDDDGVALVMAWIARDLTVPAGR